MFARPRRGAKTEARNYANCAGGRGGLEFLIAALGRAGSNWIAASGERRAVGSGQRAEEN